VPSLPDPPRAPRHPHRLESHGDERIDDWFWLRDRDLPETIAYLEAENAYAELAMEPTRDLQEQLFGQIKARILETDVSAPTRHGAWWYYRRTVEGLPYGIYCRQPGHGRSAADILAALADTSPGEAADEQVLLDENELAGGSDAFALGVLDVSPDHHLLAYASDLTGAERYTLRFRDLRSGRVLDDTIENVYYGSAWAADSQTLFYTRPDEAMRPWQVWRHRLGRPVSEDVVIFQEDDERFFVDLHLSRSERFVIVTSQSKLTSEARVLEAARPEDGPRIVAPRRQGVEYEIEHAVLPGRGDVWLVLTNAAPAEASGDGAAKAENFALYVAPVDRPGGESWRLLLPHRPSVRLEAVDAFATHLVVAEREQGLEHLRVITTEEAIACLSLGDGAGAVEVPGHRIEQPEPVYSVQGADNPEFDAPGYRFGYTSLVTPHSVVEHDFTSGERTLIKQQPVLGDYDASHYRTDRLWAAAPDGTAVPISVVHRRDVARDGSAPCLLYGYGSYEVTIDPAFSLLRLNLLERGFVFAIAHVRGGGELGRPWYENGKLGHKRNTFTDFIACAEHLIAERYTSSERLVIRGGSAGGLLVGAVVNLRPDLFTGAVAEVPFVDCVTTMLDETLPLTVTEWEEWGNPAEDAEAYAYMKSYSPYDNVAEQDYPALYVTAGINDPRVGFWEPAKWVAKLRDRRRGDRLLLLRTEMGAGHAGPTGRYETWRDEARIQAFILTIAGPGA
jgi:oligopeptidase B